MSRETSPYDSMTFGNPLSLRVDSNYLSIMSIAPCGRDAVLAGRKGLLIVDLDDPFAHPRWLHHETAWEVADVQWSPHSSKPSWIVSTSNQKAMVWNLARPSNDAIEYVLHSHTRAITDIHFHPQNPEMLATCSVDSFVLAWDLRCPKEPAYQFSDWRAAASQVKWNYKDPNIVASSHDNHILIWDIRKGAIPMKNLEGHDAKINGLDWSRENRYELISSSNDMSVKFWSFEREYEKPVYTIRTDFPVSKSRHLPFGDHVCGIMPLRGGNNSVYIVDYKGKNGESGLNPCYTFKGHTEPIKDFVWRTRHSPNTTTNDSEFQLVTWSSDRDLRLWPSGEDMYEKINYKRHLPLKPNQKLVDFEYKSYRPEPYVSSENKLIIRHRHRRIKGAQYVESSKSNEHFNHLNWISGIKIGKSAFEHVDNDPNSATFGDSNSNQPMNLGEEVSNVGHKFPKLRFERISVSTGVLVISLNGPWSTDNKDDLIFIRVEIIFPPGYPSKIHIPKFKVEETHDLKPETRIEILKNLQEISNKFCSSNRYCLEPCLRYLLGEKIDLESVDEHIDSYELGFKESEDSDNISSISPGVSDVDTDENDDDDDEKNPNSMNDDSTPQNDVNIATDSIPFDNKKAAFDSTPVSKGCGAIWTPSGHLVCFFISKTNTDNQQIIKFGQQGFSLVRSLKRKNVGNGMQLRNDKFIDDALNESDSYSDLSDDSLSNDYDVLQYDRLYRTKVPELLKNSNLNNNRQYSSNARSNPMSAPTEKSQVTSNSKSHYTRNIVKVYDFRDLIPAKMELAYEYRVLGDTPHLLAKHNAEVAEKYGYHTIANCWKLLSIILLKDVIIDEATTQTLIEKIGQNTDNLDLINNYRFYWGFHPFGGTWLVKQLFEYFKKINDIQMLAMLSCILFENTHNKDKIQVSINSPYSGSDHHINIKRSILANKKMNNMVLPRTDSLINNSFGHMNLISPQPMSHCQSTVSFNNRHYSKSIYSFNPASSPINFSMAHRIPSVSTLSSSEYNNNDSRSFKSSSPAGEVYPSMSSHNKRGIKHQGTGMAVIEPNSVYDGMPCAPQLLRTISTASSNVFNQQFTKSLTHSNNSSKLIETELDGAPVVNVQMMNTKELDLYEDQYCVNIEAFVDSEQLKIFRSDYASMLFCWGLPSNRLKILKFNYHNNFVLGNKSKVSAFEEHCGEIGWCEDAKIEEGDSPHMKWNKTQDKTKCQYCELEVRKRLSVCYKCNHIMHDTCAIIWWEEEGMDECPSGCGCNCIKQTHNSFYY